LQDEYPAPPVAARKVLYNILGVYDAVRSQSGQ